MLNNSIESRKDLKAWRYLPESLLDSKSNVDYRLVSCTLAGGLHSLLLPLPLFLSVKNSRTNTNGAWHRMCRGFLLSPLSLPQPTLPSSTSAGHPKHGLGDDGGTRHFLPLPPLCDGTERHFDCHSLSACLFYEGRFQQLLPPNTPYCDY